jgi:hypothetical protein
MRTSIGTVVSIAGALLLAATGAPGGPVPAATPATRDAPGKGHFDEYRYRVIGKVRLVLFWKGRDGVGTARMTRHGDGTTNTLTFFVGSDPQHAPKHLNEWSYLREEVQPTQAEVFALRSLDKPEPPPDARDLAANGQAFDVSCASVNGDAVRSLQTKVNAPGVTYRMFDRLLEEIAASPQWEEQRIARPPGAAAGFLSAMQAVIRAGRTDAVRGKALAPITYVYNNAVYELTVRGTDWLGRTRIGRHAFDRLIRHDLAIRKVTTREVSRFSVTYSPEPAGPALPVQIVFQPSFWLRVELRLDDEADVPADPSSDGAMLTRLRAICAGARQ